MIQWPNNNNNNNKLIFYNFEDQIILNEEDVINYKITDEKHDNTLCNKICRTNLQVFENATSLFSD